MLISKIPFSLSVLNGCKSFYASQCFGHKWRTANDTFVGERVAVTLYHHGELLKYYIKNIPEEKYAALPTLKNSQETLKWEITLSGFSL